MEVDESGNTNGSVNSGVSNEDIFSISHENVNLFDTLKDTYSQPTNSSIKSVSSTSKQGSTNTDITWRGVPLSDLRRNTGKQKLFPPVVVGLQHSVLFKLPVKEDKVPKPWPEDAVDVWDQNHVRMPHSASSLYPVTDSELRRRWELVEESLRTTISTSRQFEAAILHYNSKYCDRWDFQALHSFFSETLEEMETEYFFTKVLPKVIDLALSLPKLVTNGIPLLRQHSTHSISLSQQQISCLLANALLCTFPRRNTSKRNSEYSSFPDINFNRMFGGQDAEKKGRLNSLHEKLKCLINYFRRITTKVPDGVVTFSRHYVSPNELPVWSNGTAQLTDLYVSNEGTIEDEGTGMLEMDFANRFVGGGVLGHGCVQEEIRFVTYPELILARLFTEALDDTEALIISGCERFSIYRGYSNSFEWAGDYQDKTPKDSFGRRCCTVVAIDASRFPSAKTQYSAEFINRELNKAYAGFSWGMSQGSNESVATGNWGCGAFRGDAKLKGLLQIMVAAQTRRSLAYFTFGDEGLRDALADMHRFLVGKQITVSRLWKVISSFNPSVKGASLYDHIYHSFSTTSVPKLMEETCSPRPFKIPKVKENSIKEVPGKKSEVGMNNGHRLRLSTEEIVSELDVGDEESEHSGPKPAERRTLNVNQDKELCLKRLSSSWTNLNESKKDFGSNPKATFSEPKPESLTPTSKSFGSMDLNRQSTSSKQSRKSVGTKQNNKKISDYFQSVSKS